MFSKETIEFIKNHINQNVNDILLSSNKNYNIDIKEASIQILSRQKAKNKFPELYNNFELIFPAPVSIEQSSSNLTALYKQRFSRNQTVADITGGFGIDTLSFSNNALKVNYYERNIELAKIAKHNFNILNKSNIIVCPGEFLSQHTGEKFDLIYADPSRRDKYNSKKIILSDYEPIIPVIKKQLFDITSCILIKISPMADISATIMEFEETTEIHIISVNNECKELLFLLEKEHQNKDIKVFTANLFEDSFKNQYFQFDLTQESICESNFTDNKNAKYLYEPNSSILKAGAFKVIGEKFSTPKLHRNTHLYRSSSYIKDFPGRIFEIIEEIPFNNKYIKIFNKKYPKVNISTRNFPLTPKELRHRLKTEDGGEIYVFGVTNFQESRNLLICKKAI